ncbi:MAG: phage holin family protein [Polyangiaceae bacterium]
MELDRESAGDLVKRAVGQIRDLVAAEMALAGREASRQARQFVASVIVGALAVGLLTAAFAMSLVAIFIAAGPSVAAAGVMAGMLGVVALMAALVAFKLLPKRPLARTAARVEHEVREVKEAIAS